MTATQKRIADLLADGLPHSRHELRQCLWDEAGHWSNVQPHISHLRKALREKGMDILCTIHKRTVHYQKVKLVKNGKKAIS